MNRTQGRRTLFIDLTRQWYETRETGPEIAAAYPAGIALATYLLQRALPPGTDPLSADSVLAFAPGMFAGTPYPGATRVGIAAKSPQTGLWAGGSSGSRFAWALSQTEWDAVVIQGKSPALSYLLLDEGRVFFRSAEELAGASCSASQKWLVEKWGQGAAAVCIGPSGEAQVRFATLADGSLEAPIRGGLGAVFGSKNLKAIVVRPYLPVKSASTGEFLEAVLPLLQEAREPKSGTLGGLGTVDLLGKLARAHALPVRNFQAADCSEMWLGSLEDLTTQARSCPGCPAACLELLQVDAQASEGASGLPLNPEPLWALGPLLDLAELDDTLATIAACGESGLDPVSLGVLAAWMAECREREIRLGLADLVPEFGGGSWLPALPARIVEDAETRELLGRGVRGAAQVTGPAGQGFAMHYCGQELSFVDPRRGFWPVSPLGPAVLIPGPDSGPTPAFRPEEESVPHLIQVENLWALFESAGICKWVGLAQEGFGDNLAVFARLVSEMDRSAGWAGALGERCANLIRAFNRREGWRVENSGLPRMFFEADLTTPRRTYPALDARAWQEGVRQWFSHWEMAIGAPAGG